MSLGTLHRHELGALGFLAVVWGSYALLIGFTDQPEPRHVVVGVSGTLSVLFGVFGRTRDWPAVELVGTGFGAVAAGSLAARSWPSLYGAAIGACAVLGFAANTFTVATDSSVLRLDL